MKWIGKGHSKFYAAAYFTSLGFDALPEESHHIYHGLFERDVYDLLSRNLSTRDYFVLQCGPKNLFPSLRVNT